MTEQTSIALKGEQWKQLALLSYTQLAQHLQGIPGNTESGDAGITDEQLALIDSHLSEARLFLRSWRATKLIMPTQGKAAEPVTNGAIRPKRKYTRRAAAGVPQQ